MKPARAIKNKWSGSCAGLVFIALATALDGKTAGSFINFDLQGWL